MKNILIVFFLIVLAYKVSSKEVIVMIDSGISRTQAISEYLCKDGLKTTIPNDSGIDDYGHGTNIFGIIAKRVNIKTQCIISIKVWKPNLSGVKSMEYAVSGAILTEKLNPTYVNISMNGDSYSVLERKAFKKMTGRGVVIAVASGNDSLDLDDDCTSFPACYKLNSNFVVVGAFDLKMGNIGSVVDIYTVGSRQGFPVMSGTSQATAVFTSILISK